MDKPAGSLGRRLRVGMVSADLREHPVGRILLGTLPKLALHGVDVHLYSNTALSDSITDRLKASVVQWLDVSAMSDSSLCNRIRNDGIDVLVDLSGHTEGHRLPVFALRAAPVQATWLGYWATTGIEQMDWFIADRDSLPTGVDWQFTERIWRLPHSRWCFPKPDLADLEVAELPAASRGVITFGCFNNLRKISDRVIGVWSKILSELPGSRLLLKTKQLSIAEERARIPRCFESFGISANRIDLAGHSPIRDYMTAYNEVDIALDPFPFPGGMTTIDTLWMGVPVLTMEGRTLISRQGSGILRAIGMLDWIAHSEDEYVERAVAFAKDPEKLRATRHDLRKRMEESPLMDCDRFAKDLCEAFLEMLAQRQQA